MLPYCLRFSQNVDWKKKNDVLQVLLYRCSNLPFENHKKVEFQRVSAQECAHIQKYTADLLKHFSDSQNLANSDLKKKNKNTNKNRKQSSIALKN